MKFFPILLILLLACFFRSLAQEPLNHEKKIYQSAEGKLYINKALPVYLRIATSPEKEAESVLLISHDSEKYTNPMYFDTEGINTIRSPYKVDTTTKKVVYPREDIIFEVYTDSRPPSVHMDFGKQKHFLKDNIHYISGNYAPAFKRYDAMSGVEGVYVSIDGTPYKKYEAPFQLDQQREYTLLFYGVDNVGNAQKPQKKVLYIDKSAPTSSLEVIHDEYQQIVSVRSKIKIEATDEGSGVKHIWFQLDEKPRTTYRNSPISLTSLNEGEHKITYYAEDNSGNEEPPREYTFFLDKTPPILVEELLGATFVANGKEYASGRSRVKLTAMDNKAGVKEIRYAINNGEFTTYTSPFSVKASGNLSIQTFVQDNVNNQQVRKLFTSRKQISYVDLTGPKLSYGFLGPSFKNKDTTFITKDTQITLSATDRESGTQKIEYRVDKAATVAYTAPFQVESAGLHTIEFTGYDNVQNTYTDAFTLVTDNEGPKIFHRFSIVSEKEKNIQGEKIPVYPPHVVLFLSATDQLVGLHKLYYALNGGKNQNYQSLIQGFTPNKRYNVKVNARDKLGNSSVSEFSFYIE